MYIFVYWDHQFIHSDDDSQRLETPLVYFSNFLEHHQYSKSDSSKRESKTSERNGVVDRHEWIPLLSSSVQSWERSKITVIMPEISRCSLWVGVQDVRLSSLEGRVCHDRRRRESEKMIEREDDVVGKLCVHTTIQYCKRRRGTIEGRHQYSTKRTGKGKRQTLERTFNARLGQRILLDLSISSLLRLKEEPDQDVEEVIETEYREVREEVREVRLSWPLTLSSLFGLETVSSLSVVSPLFGLLSRDRDRHLCKLMAPIFGRMLLFFLSSRGYHCRGSVYTLFTLTSYLCPFLLCWLVFSIERYAPFTCDQEDIADTHLLHDRKYQTEYLFDSYIALHLSKVFQVLRWWF